MRTVYKQKLKIMKQKEKVLTREVVKELGLDKVNVITSNMLKGYTSIGYDAFLGCSSITSITLPNSVTSIGYCVFYRCRNLNSIVIGDKTFETQEIVNGKCKAYKAFNVDMTYRGFQYEEGKTYEIKGKPKFHKYGFHACLSLADVFDYYCGKLGKDFVIYEVELENVSDERHEDDSTVVAKKITIGKRIL